MQAMLPPQVATVPPSPFRACPPTPQSITAGRLEADGPSSRITGPPLEPQDHDLLTFRGSGVLLRTPSATLRDSSDGQGDPSVRGPSMHACSPEHGSRATGGPSASWQRGFPCKSGPAEPSVLDSLAEEDDGMSSGDDAQSSAQGSDVHATASSPGPAVQLGPGRRDDEAAGSQTPQHVPPNPPTASAGQHEQPRTETTQVLHHFEGGMRVQEVPDVPSRDDLGHSEQLLRDPSTLETAQTSQLPSEAKTLPEVSSEAGVRAAVTGDRHKSGGSGIRRRLAPHHSALHRAGSSQLPSLQWNHQVAAEGRPDSQVMPASICLCMVSQASGDLINMNHLPAVF